MMVFVLSPLNAPFCQNKSRPLVLLGRRLARVSGRLITDSGTLRISAAHFLLYPRISAGFHIGNLALAADRYA